MKLQAALDGERLERNGPAGRVSYYVLGQGEPVLLVHSVNAAASAREMQPVFDHLAPRRRVFALDLPGFGFSDRSRRDYGVDLFVAAVADMLALIEAECPGSPVDAMALSLGGEFLARAAVQTDSPPRTLTLITPTGFNRRAAESASTEPGNREVPGMLAGLSLPLLSPALFGLLTTQASVNYFLKRTWGSDQIDQDLARYSYQTSHQPGARYAPLAFLSGRLFSRDIPNVYRQLKMPVWVPHGTRGDFKDFSGADWARDLENWRFQPFHSGALPHFEQPVEFCESLDIFLDSSISAS